MKEAENPLMDVEEEEEKNEGLLDTESLEQRLLDGGARLDDLLAPYEVALGKVSEHVDAAAGARDRERFVRSCVCVQAIFLQDHLSSWPWRPGAQETDPATRAEKSRRSAEAFRIWMGS